jgi:hypothetical protein
MISEYRFANSIFKAVYKRSKILLLSIEGYKCLLSDRVWLGECGFLSFGMTNLALDR